MLCISHKSQKQSGFSKENMRRCGPTCLLGFTIVPRIFYHNTSRFPHSTVHLSWITRRCYALAINLKNNQVSQRKICGVVVPRVYMVSPLSPAFSITTPQGFHIAPCIYHGLLVKVMHNHKSKKKSGF